MPMPILKFAPAVLIEELRDLARERWQETFPDVADIELEELTEWEAADLLQTMLDALTKIAAGAGNPQEIANEIVDPARHVLRNAKAINRAGSPPDSIDN